MRKKTRLNNFQPSSTAIRMKIIIYLKANEIYFWVCDKLKEGFKVKKAIV